MGFHPTSLPQGLRNPAGMTRHSWGQRGHVGISSLLLTPSLPWQHASCNCCHCFEGGSPTLLPSLHRKHITRAVWDKQQQGDPHVAPLLPAAPGHGERKQSRSE